MRFLKTKELNSYYILFGDNEIFKKEFLKQVKEILKDQINDTTIFNFDVTDKENPVSVEDIIEKASSLTFFSPKNLIIVREFHKLSKDEIEKLFLFLNKIPDFTHVVLISSIDRNEFKKNIIDEMPIKYIFNFSNRHIADLKTWFKEYLDEYKKAIDEEILDYIIDESNADASLIKNEIDKILLWIGDRDSINKEDFNMLRGGDKEYNIWALTDAIGFKDEKKTFAIIEKIFDDFEPEMILGSIFQTLKRIYMIKYYLSKNNEKKAMEIINYNSRALAVVKKQIMNFLKVPFVEILNIIMEADRKIKKSRASDAKIAIYIMLEKIFLRLNMEKVKNS